MSGGRDVEKGWGYFRVSASLPVCPGLPVHSYPAGVLLGQDGGGEGLYTGLPGLEEDTGTSRGSVSLASEVLKGLSAAWV